MTSDYVFTDVRYINEADYIRAKGGLVIRVDRPNIPRRDTEAETQLDGYKDFAYRFKNDETIEELYEKVDLWYKSITLLR